MELNEYQAAAKKTAVYPNAGSNIIYPTLGLVGEAGETANKVKKILRDGGGKMSEEAREAIKEELGDILWYVSQLAVELSTSFEEIASGNLEKLASRQERDVLGGSGDRR